MKNTIAKLKQTMKVKLFLNCEVKTFDIIRFENHEDFKDGYVIINVNGKEVKKIATSAIL